MSGCRKQFLVPLFYSPQITFPGRRVKFSLDKGSAGLKPLLALALFCIYVFTTTNIFLLHMGLSKSLSFRYSTPTAVDTIKQVVLSRFYNEKLNDQNLMRKCEIKHIKKHKKVRQEIDLPLNSLVTFCLTLNVKSINYTHNVLLQSLILCSKPACSTENELVQPSLSNEKGPVGLSRMALRSAPPMEVRGKLHYVQFSRRK